MLKQIVHKSERDDPTRFAGIGIGLFVSSKFEFASESCRYRLTVTLFASFHNISL